MVSSYFDNTESLLSIMQEEETFILKSSERRRILIDLYETNLSKLFLEQFRYHIEQISPRIIKLAIASDRKSLLQLHKVLKKVDLLKSGQIYFCTDMEDGKTWLVSD